MTATIVIEDGSIVSGANSYVSASTLNTFAADRGITITGTKEDLIIQAMDYIEQLNFKGVKFTQTQSLQWPRADVYIDGYYFSTTEIPQQLKDGLCQCAIAIDQGNDPMQDLARSTVREKVGDLEIEYAGGSSVTINRKILNTLQKVLEAGGQTKVSKA